MGEVKTLIQTMLFARPNSNFVTFQNPLMNNLKITTTAANLNSYRTNKTKIQHKTILFSPNNKATVVIFVHLVDMFVCVHHAYE